MSKPHSSGAYGIHLQIDPLAQFQLEPLDLQALKMFIFATAHTKAGLKENGIMFTDNSGAVNVLSALAQ